jgi:hypothetical protein
MLRSIPAIGLALSIAIIVFLLIHQQGICTAIPRIPGIMEDGYLLNPNTTFLLRDGRGYDMSYFPHGSSPNIQLEPKRFGPITNIMLLDGDDGKQRMDLLYRHDGQNYHYEIRFDSSGQMILRDTGAKAKSGPPPPSTSF